MQCLLRRLCWFPLNTVEYFPLEQAPDDLASDQMTKADNHLVHSDSVHTWIISSWLYIVSPNIHCENHVVFSAKKLQGDTLHTH